MPNLLLCFRAYTRSVVFALFVASVAGSAMPAQQPAPHVASSHPPAANSAVDPYSRYTMPAQCAQHAVRLERQFWRANRPDTTRRARWGNPFQPEVVAATRRCVARFSVATTATDDLFFLGEAYVAANMDTQADSAFKKLLAAHANAPIPARASWLLQIVDVYANARPARLVNAEAYAAQLDKLGAEAASERMVARKTLVRIAEIADSVPMIRTELAAALSAATQLPADARRQRAWDEASLRASLAEWYARRSIADSAVLIAKQALADLSGARRGIDARIQQKVDLYGILGRPAVPLEATWWYGPGKDSVHPAPGKITLFTMIGFHDMTYPGIGALRRLYAKYGDRLDIVSWARTEGVDRGTLVTPEVETEKKRAYVYEFLRNEIPFPVTLGVVNVNFRWRLDGRFENLLPPSVKAYWPALSSRGAERSRLPIVVVDRTGRVRWAVGLDQETEATLDHILSELQ